MGDIASLNLIIIKRGEQDLPGLTDGDPVPRRLGPKRVGKIMKMFNLTWKDDVNDYVVRRKVVTKSGNKILKKNRKSKDCSLRESFNEGSIRHADWRDAKRNREGKRRSTTRCWRREITTSPKRSKRWRRQCKKKRANPRGERADIEHVQITWTVCNIDVLLVFHLTCRL